MVVVGVLVVVFGGSGGNTSEFVADVKYKLRLVSRKVK
jgi:hypothetical protein